MRLNLTLDLPTEVEDRLRRETSSLETDVKEAYVMELFRRGRLSHYELSQALGLDRFETDAFLKRHQMWDGALTMEEMEADRQTLKNVLGTGR
jgi:predicted HTH domain antitoxin